MQTNSQEKLEQQANLEANNLAGQSPVPAVELKQGWQPAYPNHLNPWAQKVLMSTYAIWRIGKPSV